MESLPLEMICEIASHLKGSDLISFSLVNKDTNSILNNRISKGREYYRMCVVYDYNKRVFDKYTIDNCNGKSDSYYLKCLLCFRRQRFKYPVKYDDFICRRCCRIYDCPYDNNAFKEAKCNCLRSLVRDFIIYGMYHQYIIYIIKSQVDHKCI